MAIPANKVNLRDTAKQFKRDLDVLYIVLNKAKTSMSGDRADLVSCYSMVSHFLDKVSQMSSAGLTASVIGSYLDQEFGIDYTQLEADYNTLKDTDLPSLRDKIKQYESEIISGKFNESTYRMQLDSPLSQIASDDLNAALDDCLSRFI